MKLPPVLAVGALALVLLGPTAIACHGTISGIGVSSGCVGNTCGFFYLVSSGGIGGSSVLALYQETNGIVGVQRGDPALLQGGFDDCFAAGPKDERIL